MERKPFLSLYKICFKWCTDNGPTNLDILPDMISHDIKLYMIYRLHIEGLCRINEIKIVEMMLEFGIKPNVTCLEIAVRNLNVPLMELLRKHIQRIDILRVSFGLEGLYSEFETVLKDAYFVHKRVISKKVVNYFAQYLIDSTPCFDLISCFRLLMGMMDQDIKKYYTLCSSSGLISPSSPDYEINLDVVNNVLRYAFDTYNDTIIKTIANTYPDQTKKYCYDCLFSNYARYVRLRPVDGHVRIGTEKLLPEQIPDMMRCLGYVFEDPYSVIEEKRREDEARMAIDI